MASNREAKLALHEKYGSQCQLSGSPIKSNTGGTFHHLDKYEDGGPSSIENGALLLGRFHEWLHNVIEKNDPRLYDLINECLLLYKYCLDNNRYDLINQFQIEVHPEVISHYEKIKEKRRRR